MREASCPCVWAQIGGLQEVEMEEEGHGVGTAAAWWLFSPQYRDKGVHSCLPSLRHGGSLWQLRMWVVQRGTVAETGKKTPLFLPSEDPAQQPVVLAQHAGAARSVSGSRTQRLSRPGPERLFLIYRLHQHSKMWDCVVSFALDSSSTSIRRVQWSRFPDTPRSRKPVL